MKIITVSESPSLEGADKTFTGKVRIDNHFEAPAPATTSSAIVTFEPGARTAWHTHPHGQLLYILSGEGWVQTEGQSKRTVRAGDIVWFEPDARHWHGATATKAMTHVAIVEAVQGSAAEWMDHVTDADYLGD